MELLSVTMNDGVVKRSQIEGKDNSSEDKSNYKIVRSGDLVYNSMRMWQGANGISKYDGIVSPAYTVLKAVEEIDEGYFAALFKTVKLINEFRKNSQGLTSDTWNLKYPQIAGIRICIPIISEQHKISSFLRLLDKRIDAQRQLVEALKSYKRGVFNNLYLEKIQGADEVSLGSIVVCHDSKRIPINAQTRSGREGVYPYYGANGIQGYIDDYIFDGDYILLAEDGGHFDEFNTRPIAQFISGKSWVNNHAHILEATGCAPKYLFYILEHMDIRSYINGTSRAKLNQEDMLTIRIPLPSANTQESFTIALEGIDEKMDSEQKRLNAIEELKNGFLALFFI